MGNTNSKILYIGSAGEEVKKLQTSLQNAGYDLGASGADGLYGAQTKKAVMKYQTDMGLTADGIAGEETMGSLYAESAEAPVYDISYDKALKKIVNELASRKSFSYDPSSDSLYKMYEQEYKSAGKTAMSDTMGQAASLTGGYGSTYAQSAGNGQYNSYMKKLGELIPELHDKAYTKYKDYGTALNKRYSSVASARDKEWERYLEALEKYKEGK